MSVLQSRWFYYQLQIVSIMPDYKKKAACMKQTAFYVYKTQISS